MQKLILLFKILKMPFIEFLLFRRAATSVLRFLMSKLLELILKKVNNIIDLPCIFLKTCNSTRLSSWGRSYSKLHLSKNGLSMPNLLIILRAKTNGSWSRDLPSMNIRGLNQDIGTWSSYGRKETSEDSFNALDLTCLKTLVVLRILIYTPNVFLGQKDSLRSIIMKS